MNMAYTGWEKTEMEEIRIVVTHDVGDYEVAVGSPARVIKTLDRDKF